MSVTVLILLAIVWVVVLGSQLWKRRKERMSSHSVWAFKRQLRTLRKKHAELTPIDSFRHNPAGEASYYSAFQSTNVIVGDASWASHERVSLVRVIGPQATQTMGQMEPGYSGSNSFSSYGRETDNSNYAYHSSVPVIEAGSSVSNSFHDGDEPYSNLLHDGISSYHNQSYKEGSMYASSNYNTRNLHRSGSAGLRRRRILVGLIGSVVVFFLFGLIPALGFMMILSMLGAAAAVAYIVLLARMNAARMHHAARVNTSRLHATRKHTAKGHVPVMNTRRPAHAHRPVTDDRDEGRVYQDSGRYALPAGGHAEGRDTVFNGGYAVGSEALPTRKVSGVR